MVWMEALKAGIQGILIRSCLDHTCFSFFSSPAPTGHKAGIIISFYILAQEYGFATSSNKCIIFYDHKYLNVCGRKKQKEIYLDAI